MRYTINSHYSFNPIFSTFPGGEEYVRLSNRKHPIGIDGTVEIFASIRSSKNVMQLLMLHNALKIARPEAKFKLNLGYLPYARQDRVCSKGESFSLKVFCNLINSLNFDTVYVTDCHSIVGLALLNNVKEKTQTKAALEFFADKRSFIDSIDLVVAPDAGASKKALEFSSAIKKPLVQCLKVRTDRGINVTLMGSVDEANVLVIDDIVDGGGTFIPLAEALKEAKSKHLYVTHGIFSKGKEMLNEHYDSVQAYSDWIENGN